MLIKNVISVYRFRPINLFVYDNSVLRFHKNLNQKQGLEVENKVWLWITLLFTDSVSHLQAL